MKKQSRCDGRHAEAYSNLGYSYGVSCEAVKPENVCDFLARNKELAGGHIIINAQIFKLRPLGQMIRKGRELA
jgi:hypothetical protein